MKFLNPWTARTLVTLLVLGLCGAPEIVAQSATQQPAASPSQPQNQSAPAPNAPSKPSIAPDPTAGPLEPVPSSNLPDAPSAAQPQHPATPAQQPASAPQTQPPAPA